MIDIENGISTKSLTIGRAFQYHFFLVKPSGKYHACQFLSLSNIYAEQN
jgi:hypothetical protein